MNAGDYTTDEWDEARRPIASLISKSEKAHQKLAPDTWQFRMLRDNLAALHIAFALMNRGAGRKENFTPDQLRKALASLASMIGKTRRAKATFPPGTPQHTLQRNRLKALRRADALARAKLVRRRNPGKNRRI